MVYTSLNLPYATLATLMTRDTDQRSVINLFRTGMSAIGNLIITAITFPLVTLLGNTQQAWIEVSIGYAVVSIVMLLILVQFSNALVSIFSHELPIINLVIFSFAMFLLVYDVSLIVASFISNTCSLLFSSK